MKRESYINYENGARIRLSSFSSRDLYIDWHLELFAGGIMFDRWKYG